MNFEDIVVFFMCGLSMRYGYDEEFRFNFFDTFALSKHGRHHIIGARLSYFEQLTVISLPKNVVTL